MNAGTFTFYLTLMIVIGTTCAVLSTILLTTAKNETLNDEYLETNKRRKFYVIVPLVAFFAIMVFLAFTPLRISNVEKDILFYIVDAIFMSLVTLSLSLDENKRIVTNGEEAETGVDKYLKYGTISVVVLAAFSVIATIFKVISMLPQLG